MYRFGQDIKSEESYPRKHNNPQEQNSPQDRNSPKDRNSPQDRNSPKEQNSQKEQKYPSKKSRIFQSIIKYLKKYNNCVDCN